MLFRRKGKDKKKGAPSVEMWALKRTILFIVVLVVAFFTVRAGYRFLMGLDMKKERNFKELKIGTMVSLVEESMGRPDREGEYELEQLPVRGYNEMRERAKKSGAVRFCYYENGLRTLYILGYDSKHRLVFKEKVEK